MRENRVKCLSMLWASLNGELWAWTAFVLRLKKTLVCFWGLAFKHVLSCHLWSVFWALCQIPTKITANSCWAVYSNSRRSPGLSQPSCLQTSLINSRKWEFKWYVCTLSVPEPHTYPSKLWGLLFYFLPWDIECRRASCCFFHLHIPSFLVS